MDDLEMKIDKRIRSHGIRSKFAIYEDVKSMLRSMNITSDEYERGIKIAVDLLKI